jgi:hypothetical protein
MRILAATFAYNEGEKIRRTLARHPRDRPYDLLVVDDGSTDGSLANVDPGVLVLRNPRNLGIGASMKGAFEFALDRTRTTPSRVRRCSNRFLRTGPISCRGRGSWAAADSETCLGIGSSRRA